MIRAQGEYNLATAQAQLAMEEVQARQLANRTNAIHNYYQMKEEWHARQEAKRNQNREANRAAQVTAPVAETVARAPRSNSPASLNRDAIEPDTGKITWPKALLRSDYSARRANLDQLFVLRAKARDGSGNLNRIKSEIQELSAQLRQNITSLPTGEYIEARKFLERLASTVNHG